MIRVDRENQIIPGKLWSLLDMLELKLKPFHEAIYGIVSAQRAVTNYGEATHDECGQRMLMSSLDRLRPELPSLQVGGSSLQQAFDRLERANVVGGDKKILADYLSHFQRVLNDELSGNFALVLSSTGRKLYDQAEPLFGDEVKTKFPSLAYEIDEIGKCLALDRSTAAAFHMLRCLEAAMRAVSRSLGIPDPIKGTERNWGNALKAIEAEIGNRWPKSTRISGDGVLFEKFHATLAAMANPYRNATMHLEEKYTPDEARSLLEIVRGYLKSVASRMDEDGLPLA